jgi:hypothetical protein
LLNTLPQGGKGSKSKQTTKLVPYNQGLLLRFPFLLAEALSSDAFTLAYPAVNSAFFAAGNALKISTCFKSTPLIWHGMPANALGQGLPVKVLVQKFSIGE